MPQELFPYIVSLTRAGIFFLSIRSYLSSSGESVESMTFQEASRGGLAYRQAEDFIVAMSGSFDVIIDDGTTCQRVPTWN